MLRTKEFHRIKPSEIFLHRRRRRRYIFICQINSRTTLNKNHFYTEQNRRRQPRNKLWA